MTTPVSVLVTAHNRANFLPETLNSILDQNYAPAEVLVLDDGSKDNTREVIAKFGERVKYHYVENGGVCRARNLAASLASCPYIAYCDDDDLWRSDKLEQQMSLHDRNPSLNYSFTNFCHVIDGVWTKWTKLDDAPSGFLGMTPPEGTSPVEHKGPLYDQVLAFQPIWPSTILLKRSFFDQMGGFREELRKNPSEDFDFTLRCVQYGPIGIVREPVVGARRHDLNFSGSNYANTRGQIDILIHALSHHELSESTRSIIRNQIDLRRVEASYGAFERGDFDEVLSLLSQVPSSALDTKTHLKLWISRLPLPLANAMRKLLLKQSSTRAFAANSNA